jgi:uncharacterized membrane protein YdjX (TVP38/TMEM64 family)
MRVFLAVCVGLAALALWWSGLVGELSDPERIRRLIEDAGVLAPVVFVLVTTASFWVFLLIPPVWASVTLWPLPVAFALSFASCILGSLLAYAAARRLGPEWAERRIPAGIRRHQERLEARPLTAIVVLRLVLWANPFADFLIALSRIPLRSYLIGTVVGLAPPTAGHVLFAAGGLELAKSLPVWTLALVAIAIGAAIVGVRRVQRRRRRAEDALNAFAKEMP